MSAVPRIVAILTVLLAAPVWGRACACCAEPGTRFEHSRALDEYLTIVLRQLKTAATARLFTTVDDEAVKGLRTVEDSYTVRAAIGTGNKWVYTLADAKGTTGVLTLTVPPRYKAFGVDLNALDTTDGMVRLYKEWRFAGTAVATGPFFSAPGGTALRYSLVLSGDGNMCDDAYNFYEWHLEVTGRGVAFTLFGALHS